MATSSNIEVGQQFLPQFGPDGLISTIVQDAKTGQILMFAYMNREALERTIKTGKGTFYSRSRGKLWTKGELSGHFQKVEQILVDCDQDCLLLKVTVDAGQCHTGRQSCFYRALQQPGTDKKLKFVADRVFDPEQTYEQ